MAASRYADPEIRRQAQEDEDRFLEPGSVRSFAVETHETVLEPLPETTGS